MFFLSAELFKNVKTTAFVDKVQLLWLIWNQVQTCEMREDRTSGTLLHLEAKFSILGCMFESCALSDCLIFSNFVVLLKAHCNLQSSATFSICNSKNCQCVLDTFIKMNYVGCYLVEIKEFGQLEIWEIGNLRAHVQVWTANQLYFWLHRITICKQVV